MKDKDWKAMGYPSKAMYLQAKDDEMDRNMKKAMAQHKKTRVGGGEPEKVAGKSEKKIRKGQLGETMMLDAMSYKKGGKVRGCGMAKQGVRKAKNY